MIGAAAVLAISLVATSTATAITGEELNKVPLRDDLQRSDPPPTFSASGMGAGKWSTPVWDSTRGGTYNSGGRLGYGSVASTWSGAYWNAQEFNDNGSGVAVEATLSAGIPAGHAIGLWLNMPNPGWTMSGYELYVYGTSSSFGTAYLFKWTNGSVETLASEFAITSSGTTYGLVEKGGQVSGWGKFSEGGSWINPPPFLVADKTPYKSGYGGMEVYSTGPSFDNFHAGSLPPAVPTVSSSSPASPSESTTPRIIGTAEAETTVRLYTNSSCSGEALATGGAAEFASPGLKVSVAKESTTTFYAQATNIDGLVSACSTASVKYVQHIPPAAPTLSSSNPVPPANNNSPRIVGAAAAETTVKLYSNSTCTGAVAATGTAAAFASPGLAVSVSDNSTTTYYATATDAVGNVSACSTSSVTYKEDSTNLIAEAGFEEGTLNGWSLCCTLATPTVTSADARSGTYSADVKLTGSEYRSELVFGGDGSAKSSEITFKEGDDRYYAFSFKIISMIYGKPGGHNIIMQFKSDGEGSPEFALQLWNVGGEKGLWTGGPAQEVKGGGERFLAPVSEGQWHDIVIRFVASEAGKGSYETFLDGIKVDSASGINMIVPGTKSAYIKNGLYRNNETVTGTSELLIDNARLGKTLASVGGLGHP